MTDDVVGFGPEGFPLPDLPPDFWTRLEALHPGVLMERLADGSMSVTFIEPESGSLICEMRMPPGAVEKLSECDTAPQ